MSESKGTGLNTAVMVLGLGTLAVVGINSMKRRGPSEEQRQARANYTQARADAKYSRELRRDAKNDEKVEKKNLKNANRRLRLLKKAKQKGINPAALGYG
jgi:hypothetical protein